MVALRFMAGEIARGFALDSGAVTVANPRGTVSAQARGAGLDYSAGQRVSAEVAVGALPIAPDSAQCLVRL